MLPAAGEALLARPRTRRRIEPDFQSLRMDVIGQRFHIGELLVRGDLAFGRARPLPRVIDIDIGIALACEAGSHHSVGGRANVVRLDNAAPDVPRVPAERRRQRERMLAANDGDDGVARLAFAVLHADLNVGPARLLQRTGDDARGRVERETRRKIPCTKCQRTVA